MHEKNSTTSIVSFTLAGPGTADIVGNALQSVYAMVERAIVIVTNDFYFNGTEDACEIGGIKRRAMRRWPWRDHYGDARNAGLDFAAEIGAQWACMVDTDESAICPDPAAFRAWLAALPESIAVVLVHHNDGTHTRERFFRLPARYRFTGRTHEMFPCPMREQAIAPRELIQWSELPKTPEQLRAKFLRDVDMLRADARDNPRNGAAFYYLGASLQALGRHEEAIEAFRSHHAIDGWEGGAWSCFRAAECFLALSPPQPDRALDCAAAGLVRDAGIGELYWIAGVASLVAGRAEQARCWAEAAKVHGLGSEAERRRVGFRVPRGLTTGPIEVLAAARDMMGKP